MKSTLMLYNLRWILVVSLLALPVSRILGQDLLLSNGQVLDPATQTITQGHLLIEAGHVAGILAEKPATYEGPVLDIDGHFVVPGFMDMHTHSYGNMGPNFQSADFIMTVGVAQRMVHAGVTAFLDLFSAEAYILPLRDNQRNGEVAGATIYASGPILTATEGHGTEYGVPTRTMDTPEEAITVVDSLAKSRPDVVKIVYDNQGRMPTIDKATFEAAVAASNRHQIPVVVHIGTWQDVDDAIAAGAAAVTHTPLGMPPEGLAERMAEANVAIIPTMVVQTELSRIAQDSTVLDDPLLNQLAPSQFLQAYRDTSAYSPQMKGFMFWQGRFIPDIFNAVGALANAGVPVYTGTDAGNPGVFQGYSIHREMELLKEAGLSNWETLAAATTEPAMFLNTNHGVQEGNRADLVVLSSSPLEAIQHTRTITYVIQDGVVLEREAPVSQQSHE